MTREGINQFFFFSLSLSFSMSLFFLSLFLSFFLPYIFVWKLSISDSLYDLLTAGDGCFYIGMGGKSAKPKIPSYEPYQCCPAKVAHGTKIAKATKISPAAKDKGKTHERSEKLGLPGLKPINKLTAKESRKMATIGVSKSSDQKTKKGFFGSGKYLDWL